MPWVQVAVSKAPAAPAKYIKENQFTTYSRIFTYGTVEERTRCADQAFNRILKVMKSYLKYRGPWCRKECQTISIFGSVC